MFLVAAGVVGGAGYYLWQFYAAEQDKSLNDDPHVVEQRSADEMIVDFEEQGPWSGPGAPAFGIGDDQP